MLTSIIIFSLVLLLLFVVLFNNVHRLFNNVHRLKSENEKLRNWIEKIHCETKAMYEDFEEIEDKIKTFEKKKTRGRKNGH